MSAKRAKGHAPESPARKPARTKSQSWALGLRVASGVGFVPLLILLAKVGGLAFLVFVLLTASLGLVEFFRMMKSKGHTPNVWVGFLATLAVIGMAYRPHTPHAAFLATAALLLLLAQALRHPERKGIVEGMAVTLFAVLYVGWLSSHFVLLRELPWRAGPGLRGRRQTGALRVPRDVELRYRRVRDRALARPHAAVGGDLAAQVARRFRGRPRRRGDRRVRRRAHLHALPRARRGCAARRARDRSRGRRVRAGG
ncbi:MAG: phosphatidate cytidylyltransferase [Candidatus Eisenbacteria bacterium]|nr:phosphatidate cytidylyltransferase [Candidatus Eisenbacteria bacterium]